MKKLILIGAAIVVFSMIITLTEGNFMMLKQITSESPVLVLLIKSLGFSISALIVIVYDKRKWVKLLFVVLDSAMIFCLQFFPIEVWNNVGAFIYAPYTGLNLYFIGMIITEELRIHMEVSDIRKIDESNVFELNRTQAELATTNNELALIRAKLESMLNNKLVNAKRGRGANKDENIERVENEIKEFIR